MLKWKPTPGCHGQCFRELPGLGCGAGRSRMFCHQRLAGSGELGAVEHSRDVLLLIKNMKTLRGGIVMEKKVRKLRPSDQQHRHHVGACEKSRILGCTSDFTFAFW
nr:uncharacterized protein LOC130540769 [Pan paniscus]